MREGNRGTETLAEAAALSSPRGAVGRLRRDACYSAQQRDQRPPKPPSAVPPIVEQLQARLCSRPTVLRLTYSDYDGRHVRRMLKLAATRPTC